MALSGNELRGKFLAYFASKGHQVVASSPLAPKDDPSLLFTNAGMVQFKQVFLGQEQRPYTRAATSQKCFRASGKHNDLENVGRTPRHHTFFEMLGNFSFGDYFKQDAVLFAWELLTVGFGLDPEKLWVSVHHSDDEAAELWQGEVGVRPERIVRLGDKDNFWSMGDTGPCGPCSEIHIDMGPEMGCGRPDCAVGCDCNRYLELWNLVFMQYNRDASGQTTPLPKPSIDTGMGLERIAGVVQGARSNYDSDLFTPIIERACQITQTAYGQSDQADISLRVIADHARACAFLVADGILPSNEGRGYVLRRILRRAARHGRKLGAQKPFLHQVAMKVIDEMMGAYPALDDARAFVDKVVTSEEERFNETLDTGLKLLAEAIGEAKAKGQTALPGEVAFKLYDTYGFPVDLTRTICEEEALGVDEPGFEAAMGQQKTRSRASWKGSGEEGLSGPLAELRAKGFKTAFTGYDGLEGQGQVVALIVDGQMVERVGAGQKALLVCDQTPFYGESGGQAGDSGRVEGPAGQAVVSAASKPGGDVVAHEITVSEGYLAVGERLNLTVDHGPRGETASNHTATHLLHAALRQVLGDHVKQAGSMVSPQRLRFDFSHFEAMTPQQMAQVEAMVNEGVLANIAVSITEMPAEEALGSGAMALFGEKYGDTVRVVEIPGLSKELCGGTHVKRTGDIGLFKLVAEASVAAGVRRVEALTGRAALAAVRAMEDELHKAAGLLKARPTELAERVAKLMATVKEREREVEQLKAKLAGGGGGRDLLAGVVKHGAIQTLAQKVEVDSAKALRALSDEIIERLGSGVLVLGAAAEGKAFLLARVSKDLQGRFHAGNIVKELAPLVGGGGGGRPDMAQAGGQNPDALDQAMERASAMLAEQAKA